MVPIWKNTDLADLDGEEWRFIGDTNRKYMVSNMGRIKSLKRREPRILSQGENKRTGYLNVILCLLNGTKKTKLVHSIVMETFVGPCPEGHNINHEKNPDKTDNRLYNLVYRSRSENCKHISQSGNGSGIKLTLAIAEEIRGRWRSSSMRKMEFCKKLSKEYGVSHHAIQAVILNRTWVPISGSEYEVKPPDKKDGESLDDYF